MYSIAGLLCDRQGYLLLYYQAKDTLTSMLFWYSDLTTRFWLWSMEEFINHNEDQNDIRFSWNVWPSTR